MENDYQSLENEYNRMIAENHLYDIDGDLFFDLSEYHYINGFYKEAISVLKNALKVLGGFSFPPLLVKGERGNGSVSFYLTM